MPIPFSYPLLRGAKKIIKWQVSEVSFGSGYHSATALGRDVRWQVGFVVECLEDLHSLVNVFVEAKGVDTLLWTPPLHPQSEFVLDNWRVTPLRNDAYRIDVDFKLIELVSLDGSQSADPYYIASNSSIVMLDLAAQFGSAQTTRVRNISLQYANQYHERNYDDQLRSIFNSWDIEVRGMNASSSAELDNFLNVRRGEKPFKWDDGESGSVPGALRSGSFTSDCTWSQGDGSGNRQEHFYKCKEWEFEYLVGEVEGVEECLNGVVNFKATFEQCYGIYTTICRNYRVDYTFGDGTLGSYTTTNGIPVDVSVTTIPPAFTGGQCNVPYNVVVNYTHALHAGYRCTGGTLSGTTTFSRVIGGIQRVGWETRDFVPDSGPTATLYLYNNGTRTWWGGGSGGICTDWSRYTANIVSITRVDGQPDNCGSLPTMARISVKQKGSEVHSATGLAPCTYTITCLV